MTKYINTYRDKGLILIILIVISIILSLTCGHFEVTSKTQRDNIYAQYTKADISSIDNDKIKNHFEQIKNIYAQYTKTDISSIDNDKIKNHFEQIKNIHEQYTRAIISSIDKSKIQNYSNRAKISDYGRHLFFGMVLFQIVFICVAFLIYKLLENGSDTIQSIVKDDYYIKSIMISLFVTSTSLVFVATELEVVLNNGTFADQFFDIALDQIGIFIMLIINIFIFRKEICKFIN